MNYGKKSVKQKKKKSLWNVVVYRTFHAEKQSKADKNVKSACNH